MYTVYYFTTKAIKSLIQTLRLRYDKKKKKCKRDVYIILPPNNNVKLMYSLRILDFF